MDRYRDEVLTFKEAAKKTSVFFVYDTETTGLDPADCDVIEFSAIKCRINDDGSVDNEDNIDIYINPGYPLPEKITEITGITDEELQTNGIAAGDAAELISQFLGTDPVICGYNSVSFDTAFVDKLLKTIGASFAPTIQLDVLTMAREKTPKPHKLSDMAEKLGVTGITFHRSIGDCEATLAVLKKLLPSI